MIGKTNRVADIHGHYLFGVDDGAASLNMSQEMIKSAYEQGVRHIFCTSHDSANLLYYKRNFKILQEHLRELDIDVTIHMGCEIFCEEKYIGEIIEKLENGFLLPMGSSKYILLEFSPWTTAEEIVSCVSRIRNETEYEPVIAHMERYLWLHDEPEIFDTIRENQMLVQMNSYSLVESSHEGTRNFARKLLREKLVSFIGSDAHRSDHRPVALETGIKYIYDNCDAEYAKDICYRNAEKLFIREE